jgi:hypothetical protein
VDLVRTILRQRKAAPAAFFLFDAISSFIFARTSYTSRHRKLAVSAVVRPLHPCFPVRDNERAESSFLKTRKILLNIARAWRERVDEAEKKIKDTPSSVDGD